MNKRREQLDNWISKEITGNEYTTAELETIMLLLKNKDKKKALKLLLKGHRCSGNCAYCQYALSLPIEFEKIYADNWQGKLEKAQQLTKIAEKEVKEAEQLRVKEATNLLFNNPREFFRNDKSTKKSICLLEN